MASNHRDPLREAFWRKTLKQYAASGVSVRVFCRQRKLTESTFYAWRRTIDERDREVPQLENRPAFVPAVINGETGHAEAFVLKLADNLELRMPQTTPTERVAELVHALETRAEQ